MILVPRVVGENSVQLDCRFTHICYLVDEVGIVGWAIHCIMWLHSPQGDEIAKEMCPNTSVCVYTSIV